MIKEEERDHLDTLEDQSTHDSRMVLKNSDSSKRLFIKIPKNQNHHLGTT
jgi:hypothetical protein